MSWLLTFFILATVYSQSSKSLDIKRVNGIKIYFFSNDDPSNGILIDNFNPQLAATSFNPYIDSFFFVHGWMDDVKGFGGQLLKDSILKNHDVNVFLVDWSCISTNIMYFMVVNQVNRVGEFIGSLINEMVKNNYLNLDKTTLAGHSLGGHIVGIAGRYLNGAVAQVVGLDPAGPLFNEIKTSNRLTNESGQFVEVIHTATEYLGYEKPLGHADYYPNGGKSQPSCGNMICSHMKAVEYYAESFYGVTFTSKRCDSYLNYLLGLCYLEPDSWMGGYNLDNKAREKYYLKIN